MPVVLVLLIRMYLFMYLTYVLVLPLRGSFFQLYFISAVLYLFVSQRCIFYFPALVISYLFGTYDFH